ncbi:MAG: helix-turn-helix domain-containing protein [Planctomycetota bacterium]|nr:helix-turn-helix domain-containing protein [Planctomycetota bacterium]
MTTEVKRISEWAAELGLPQKTLRTAVGRGHLKAMRLGMGPRSPYFCTRADIDAWFESRRVKRRAW